MRLLYYKKDSTKGKGIHYVNLDRVDCFSFSDEPDVTPMYAVTSSDIHILNTTKKIMNIGALMKRLSELVSGCRVDIEELINDTNTIEKQKGKRR